MAAIGSEAKRTGRLPKAISSTRSLGPSVSIMAAATRRSWSSGSPFIEPLTSIRKMRSRSSARGFVAGGTSVSKPYAFPSCAFAAGRATVSDAPSAGAFTGQRTTTSRSSAAPSSKLTRERRPRSTISACEGDSIFRSSSASPIESSRPTRALTPRSATSTVTRSASGTRFSAPR